MKNWKTSLFGVLTFLALNLTQVGVPEKWANLIAGAAVAAGLISAKDEDVTGVGSAARRTNEFDN